MHHIKSLTKKELKFLTKPWITQGMQNSIEEKTYTQKFAKCKSQKHKKIYIIARPTEISGPHSSKEQKKNISLSVLMKTLKILLRRLG